MGKKANHPGVEPVEPGIYNLRIRVRNRWTGEKINTMRRFHGTLRQAAVERRRLMREFADGRGEVRDNDLTTLGDYAKRWLTTRRAEGGKKSTMLNRADELSRNILPDFGDWYVTAIRKGDVLEWRNRAKERVGIRTKRKVSPATVNGWVRILKAVVAAYYDEYELGPSPIARIKQLKEPKRKNPNTLPADVLPLVLDKFEELYPQHYPMLFIGMTTGMRWGELSALEWDDIDEENGVIHLTKAQVRKHVDTTKTDDEIDFPLLPEMVEVLRSHRRRMIENQAPGLARGLVFPSAVGDYSYTSRFTKPLDRVRKELGIPHNLSSKVMRRTFNNLLRQAAVDRQVLRSLTGHSSEAMTATYTTVFDEERQEAVSTMVRVMKGGTGVGE